MAFGSGVLISALAFELMDEAFEKGGIYPCLIGFLIGVTTYSLSNYALSLRGAQNRKNSRKNEEENSSNSLSIALGALLDGIPEAAAIGITLTQGKGVGLVTVLAIFISNIPEGLSSSAGMKTEGKKPLYVFGLWTCIMIISSISAWIGFYFLGNLGPSYTAATLSVAAGAIFVMIIQTMVPEAFEDIHGFTGPIAALGFFTIFIATNL